MTRILGLDLGTNSIGWAVVENDNNEFTLLDKGVRIFQEGVKIEKGNESSKAAERTEYRSARRIKYRRKLRKIETLMALIEHDYCPKLTDNELNNWRYKKKYPLNDEFRNWWLTDNDTNKETRKQQTKNPYYFRALAAETALDLNVKANRHLIGRALYHLVQRRGFLSNRLETTKESPDGAVMKSISEINLAKGDLTLGQYFYEKYKNGEKIRDVYTHRIDHYLHEFETICSVQQLPKEFCEELKNAIFFQRPLRSQKGLIGKCVFEPKKPRCAVSRPEFEEYRMLCFVNNIKIKKPEDDKLRPLNPAEREKIIPLFYRLKDHFNFEDIAKQLAPKKQYKFYKAGDKNPEDTLFNFAKNTTVSGCPVSARFKAIFGDNWQQLNIKTETSTININDVWHVLYSFDNNEKLLEFAQQKLKLDNEQTKSFEKISLKQDYASLSLKAINKILPYLRHGLIYSHAVFLANMEAVIPADIWKEKENRVLIQNEIELIIQSQNREKKIADAVNSLIKTCHENGHTWSNEAKPGYINDLNNKLAAVFGSKYLSGLTEEQKSGMEAHAFELFEKQMTQKNGLGEFATVKRIDERIIDFITDHFDIAYINAEKLYHPSALDVFKEPEKKDDGLYYLNSPMVSSVRNPMAMRAMHQLRKLINTLIKQGTIDQNTRINIEMARDLKNANERKALQNWQNDRKKLREEYAKRISKYYEEHNINASPSDDDILKYQLWEEQEHKCLYTGKSIGIHEFIGADPAYDIEHTIPRSISLNNSQENKTLCENRFNRSIKKNKIPAELDNHNEIISRIEPWKETINELNKKIQAQVRMAGAATTKEGKDGAIQRRHKLALERDYWHKKYQSFIKTEVNEGFKNSQLVDIGIITKYARLYVKTLFDRVYTVKGSTVADFRKMWGLQDAYNPKQRVNHIHHCIDAVTIACITKKNYETLAKFYHDWEELENANSNQKPKVKPPWNTFVQDVKNIENEVLVSHHTPDSFTKQGKQILRKRGIKQKNKNGKEIIQQGDTARAQLHKETFYSAIKRIKEWEDGKPVFEKDKQDNDKIFYVVRKKLSDLKKADVKNIVDPAVREKVEQAVAQIGEKALQQTIWMNEEKQIPINKVRCYAPTVTNPLHIKKQRDKSCYNYKQDYNVANDGNYLMAIYEGKDAKGKVKRDFELINNLDAAKFFKASVQNELKPQGLNTIKHLLPEFKTNGKVKLYPKVFLKKGTMVMFFDKNPEEIWDLTIDEQRKRLYKCIAFENDGRVQLRYHQEARPDNELKKSSEVNFIVPNEKLRLRISKFNVLIEGTDFKISIDGKIEAIKK